VVTKLQADDLAADHLRRLLAAHEGLDHLRIRRRADVLTLESGDQADPIPRARFRRASVQYWTLEFATHTGRWERTGFRDTLPVLVDLVVTTLPWTIAPLE
jgi:hypothetical protein